MKRIENNYEYGNKIKISIDGTVNVHSWRCDELSTDVQYWGVLCCSGGIWSGGGERFLCLVDLFTESVMMNVSKYHQMLFSSWWLEYIEVHQSLFLCSAVKDRISSAMARFIGTLNIGWRVPCNKLLASSVLKTNLWPCSSNMISLPFKIKYVYKKHLKHQCHPYKHFESTQHLIQNWNPVLDTMESVYTTETEKKNIWCTMLTETCKWFPHTHTHTIKKTTISIKTDQSFPQICCGKSYNQQYKGRLVIHETVLWGNVKKADCEHVPVKTLRLF